MIVKIGGTQLTGQLNATLNAIKDIIDSTSADTAGVKASESGEYGYTFDFNSLYDPAGSMSFSEILTAFKSTSATTIYFGQTAIGADYYSASAHFNSASLSADKNDMTKVSGSLTITGDVTEAVVTSS